MKLRPGASPQVDIDAYQKAISGFHNQPIVDLVVKYVTDYRYCTIHGPVFSHKSLLLKDIRDSIAKRAGWVPVLIDLKHLNQQSSTGEFFTKFALMFRERWQEAGLSFGKSSFSAVTDEPSLSAFLRHHVSEAMRNVVLLLDHLEVLNIGHSEPLLRTFRAIYNIQGIHQESSRLIVVIASSLKVSALTLGPSSSYSFAASIKISDLSTEDSAKWIDHIAGEPNSITEEGRTRLLEMAGGDRFLLYKLVRQCRSAGLPVDAPLVNTTVESFLRDEAENFLPLRTVVAHVEAHPDIALNLFRILQGRSGVEQDMSYGSPSSIDDLELSGAVTWDGKHNLYKPRNEIYRRYLSKRFTPRQIGQLLRDKSRWKDAINFLAEQRVDREFLEDTVLEAIPRASEPSEAYNFFREPLIQHLRLREFVFRLFTINQSNSQPSSDYILERHEGLFEPPLRFFQSTNRHEEPETLIEELFDEAGVPFYRVAMWSDAARTVLGYLAFRPAPDDGTLNNLIIYLRQAADALFQLLTRDSLGSYERFAKIWEPVTGLVDPEPFLQAVVEAAQLAVNGAQKGSLYLWDRGRRKLIVRAQMGFDVFLIGVAQLDPGEGFAGWAFQTGQPVLLEDVSKDPRTKVFPQQEINELHSAICVPLKILGEPIGVLCLDIVDPTRQFQPNDLLTLAAFASHAASFMYSDQLRREFYDLGMRINRNDVSEKDIFDRVSSSIRRVFPPVIAVNLTLRHDTFNPDVSASNPLLESYADVLGEGYESRIKGGSKALIEEVFRRKDVVTVSSPSQAPGINRLLKELGVRANVGLPLKFNAKLSSSTDEEEEGEVQGVLAIHYGEEREFTETEIRILSLFANQTAQAMKNTQQRREIEWTDKVAWMGLLIPSVVHEYGQFVGAIKDAVPVEIDENVIGKDAATRFRMISRFTEELRQIKDFALHLPFEHEPTTIPLNDLLKEEVTAYTKAFPKIKPIFQLENTENVQVHVDRRWFTIVLKHLINNATKAMKGDEQPKFSVIADRMGRTKIRVVLNNSGQAVPDNVKPHLFREPVPQGLAQGQGMGAFIAARILRRYDGNMWLDPKSDSGNTRICFILPIKAYSTLNSTS